MSDSRFGDDGAGFTVGFDRVADAVRVRAWGFWDPELGRAFSGAVLGACQSHRGVQRVVMDMNDLKPMRDEGQASFAHVVKALPALGITRVSVTTTSQLTRLQLLRLAGAQAVREFLEVTTGNASELGA